LKLEEDNSRYMSELERDTSRTVVQTYVPAYQRDEWDRHAEQLNMSRSEFVRTMVQAGRRGFGADTGPESGTEAGEAGGQEPLDDQVREELTTAGPLSWEELLAAVTGDIESRLENTLQRLQENDELRYSGRRGGYVLEDGETA
jgi:hypothetical protein